MCVGQHGGLAQGRAPEDCPDGAVAEGLAARLLEGLVKGLSSIPAGPERVEECSRRRRILASKLWELQSTLREITALGQVERQSLAPLLQRAHGCCTGLRRAAAVLKAQETAELKDAEAAAAAEAWGRLEAALSACQGQVRRLAAPGAGAARRPLQARSGCMAGLRRLWAKPDLQVAEDPCMAEAVLVIQDPSEAQQLSCIVGATAPGAVLLGSPRASVQRLAHQGEAFDVVPCGSPPAVGLAKIVAA